MTDVSLARALTVLAIYTASCYNFKKLSILPTHCTDVLLTFLITRVDFVPIQE